MNMSDLNPKENPFGAIMVEMVNVASVGIKQGINLANQQMLEVMKKHIESCPAPLWMDLMSLINQKGEPK